MYKGNENIVLCDHPLVKHKITMLRNKNTGTNEFRAIVEEIAMLVGYEALRDLELEDVEKNEEIEDTINTNITEEYSKPMGVSSIDNHSVNIELNNSDEIVIEGTPRFDNAIITLRQSGLRFQSNKEHPTITATYGMGGGNFTILAYKGHVGGITPRQCFKLMGFEYEDADLLKENGFSVSSLYEMAGRTVVVPVLEGIFKNLLLNNKEE